MLEILVLATFQGPTAGHRWELVQEFASFMITATQVQLLDALLAHFAVRLAQQEELGWKLVELMELSIQAVRRGAPPDHCIRQIVETLTGLIGQR